MTKPVNSQRGITLVELVIAMSIMSFLLVGIGSALLVANRAANLWSQQVTEGQTLNQLAGTLDQDLHRYVPCSPQVSNLRLDLCLPSQTSPQPSGIEYSFISNDLIRAQQWPGGGSSVVARGLVIQPRFAVDCRPGQNVDSGDVTISGLTYTAPPGFTKPAPAGSSPPLVVYFRAPVGSCQ